MKRFLQSLHTLLMGRRLREAIARHDRAAATLDHAIREVMK